MLLGLLCRCVEADCSCRLVLRARGVWVWCSLVGYCMGGRDGVGGYCVSGGLGDVSRRQDSDPLVRCRPPRREAGRKCALSIAVSDSSWWKVPNTPGMVDYVLCNKCASFFQGGTMADQYNGRVHYPTLLRDFAVVAGLTPSWMPVRIVPQTSHNWHVLASTRATCTVQENNNDKVFGLAGCHVFETSVGHWDSLYAAENPGHHIWDGKGGEGLHHSAATGEYVGARLAETFRALDWEHGICLVVLQMGWNIKRQDQDRENPVYQELLMAEWGADIERIVWKYAPEYQELMYVVRANSWQFKDLRTETEDSKKSKHRHENVPRYSNPVYGKTSDLGSFFPDDSIYVARRHPPRSPEIILGCEVASEEDSILAWMEHVK